MSKRSSKKGTNVTVIIPDAKVQEYESSKIGFLSLLLIKQLVLLGKLDSKGRQFRKKEVSHWMMGSLAWLSSCSLKCSSNVVEGLYNGADCWVQCVSIADCWSVQTAESSVCNSSTPDLGVWSEAKWYHSNLISLLLCIYFFKVLHVFISSFLVKFKICLFSFLSGKLWGLQKYSRSWRQKQPNVVRTVLPQLALWELTFSTWMVGLCRFPFNIRWSQAGVEPSFFSNFCYSL